MSALIPIYCSDFYKFCLRLCAQARVPLHNYKRSKRMYNNIVHVFLLVMKERLNVSYRRFVKLAGEMNLQRMLGIKRIPHFTTIQKALQRLPKALLELMVRSCRKLLSLNKVEAGIDGTGFSNTNPSHYYAKRVDGVEVRNFTKTVLIADLNSKLVLNMNTASEHEHETLSFIPLVRELKHSLKRVLADKAYDSAANRRYCWGNNIDVHIPIRVFKSEQLLYGRKQVYQNSQRRKAARLFNAIAYKRRALIESVNSAIKRPFGSHVCSRRQDNQCKQATIKVLAYNLELIGRTLTAWLVLKLAIFLHRRAEKNHYIPIEPIRFK